MKKFITALLLTASLATPASAGWGCFASGGHREFRTWNSPTQDVARHYILDNCASEGITCQITTCVDGVNDQAGASVLWPLASSPDRCFGPNCSLDDPVADPLSGPEQE